jgi:hypothetical protein
MACVRAELDRKNARAIDDQSVALFMDERLFGMKDSLLRRAHDSKNGTSIEKSTHDRISNSEVLLRGRTGSHLQYAVSDGESGLFLP